MSMFSVDINGAGGAGYIKPKKGTGTKRPAQHTNIDLTKQGSLFNDPKIFTAEPTSTTNKTILAGRRTVSGGRGGQSIFNNMNFVSGGTQNASGSGSSVNSLDATLSSVNAGSGDNNPPSDDLGIGRDPDKGLSAAKEFKSTFSDTRSDINSVESDGESAEKLGKRGIKLQKQIQKNDDKFKENQANQQAELKSIEAERKALTRNMTTTAQLLAQHMAELDAEIESGGSSKTIGTLSSLISEHRETLTVNGQRVNVLGKSSKSLITQMNKTSSTYVSTNKSLKSESDSNTSKMSDAMETAQQIIEYSTIVETTGTIIESIGKLFKACSGIPFVGAALAAAGAVMEPIGKTGKMIGQWGKTAGQITMTIEYATQGNWQAAFTCAASAVQSGMSALQSTKQAIGDWKNLNNELKDIKSDALDAKARRAEAKAERAQAKADKANAKAGVDNNGAKLDADGNATDDISGKTNAQNKADNLNGKASELRGEADARRNAINEQRINNNYNDAKDAIQQNKKMSDAQKQEALRKLDAERDNALEQIHNAKPGEQVNIQSDLMKGTTFNKNQNVNVKSPAGSKVGSQAGSKAKSILKKIFSQNNLAAVGQAMTFAGSICAMMDTSSSNTNNNSNNVNFQISARAQHIVAKTMNRMGYAQPGMFKVSTR